MFSAFFSESAKIRREGFEFVIQFINLCLRTRGINTDREGVETVSEVFEEQIDFFFSVISLIPELIDEMMKTDPPPNAKVLFILVEEDSNNRNEDDPADNPYEIEIIKFSKQSDKPSSKDEDRHNCSDVVQGSLAESTHIPPIHANQQKRSLAFRSGYPDSTGTTYMNVTFLGTSGAIPTTERNTSALCVRREGERFLFDCGEGTQRQMMRYGTGFDISHVFLTHIHGDHVLGLPGLCQTWDFNDRETPLTIHTAPGTKSEIETLIGVLGTHPSYPVHVNEVRPGSVVLRDEEYEVRAFRTQHRTRSVGYAIVEDERKGRFDREQAEELGVPVGPKFSKLHNGESVKLEDGTIVHPEQVVGPPRPGRRLVYTGDTRPTDATVESAQDADLLIHDATFAEDKAERARPTGHSTATEAAEIADQAGTKRLALTHISTRYGGYVEPHEHEAREVFDGEVFVPDDGLEIDIPYPDKRE
jgi:ribonuclease Z